MSDNNNAPMNKWVYYKNCKDSHVRYYMHRLEVRDIEMAVYIIHCEYGCGMSDSPTRDEYLYATQKAAQQALNLFTNWEDREE